MFFVLQGSAPLILELKKDMYLELIADPDDQD